MLSAKWEELLGYAPRVDVLLARNDGGRRLWVEFEVSRADPVANHAKFATAHFFQPLPVTDVFVSMVSAHVARGRQNLAANTIYLMRRNGMRAYQTVLMPQYEGEHIQYLNQLPFSELTAMAPTIEPEIERAMSITEPLNAGTEKELHFAGNLLEVLLNVRRWNVEMESSDNCALWGRRTVTYFVFDPFSQQFAPAKFCAYIAVPVNPMSTDTEPSSLRAEMTVGYYVTLGEDRRFDGHAAQQHLVTRLGMQAVPATSAPDIEDRFRTWLLHHDAAIAVHPGGPSFIVPPPWFR